MFKKRFSWVGLIITSLIVAAISAGLSVCTMKCMVAREKDKVINLFKDARIYGGGALANADLSKNETENQERAKGMLVNNSQGTFWEPEPRIVLNLEATIVGVPFTVYGFAPNSENRPENERIATNNDR